MIQHQILTKGIAEMNSQHECGSCSNLPCVEMPRGGVIISSPAHGPSINRKHFRTGSMGTMQRSTGSFSSRGLTHSPGLAAPAVRPSPPSHLLALDLDSSHSVHLHASPRSTSQPGHCCVQITEIRGIGARGLPVFPARCVFSSLQSPQFGFRFRLNHLKDKTTRE